MNRRLLTLVLAAAALAALVATAVPALGSDAVAPKLDRRASAGALAKAKRALRVARSAKRVARRAGGRAGEARVHANAAQALAEENRSQAAKTRSQLQSTQAELAALKKELAAQAAAGGIASATESAPVATSAPFGEYEAAGGPSVQATVPASGLIEVWAEVEIEDEGGGAVGLFEDGRKVTGISAPEYCGDPGGVHDGSALIDMQGGTGSGGAFAPFSTPPNFTFLGCASTGAPAPVLLSRPPGPHTYELRYSQCSCGTGAEFRNRTLRVAPRP